MVVWGCSIGAAAMAAFVATSAAGQTAAPPYLTLAQLRAAYAQPQSRYAVIRGAEIHYIDEGRGEVVVLVHGSNSSLKTYDRVAAVLARRFRVIRFDQPGMGLSGPAPQALLDTPLYPVVVMEDLLTRLHVTSATFVGVSSGGTMAFYLAARRPDLVRRLVMANTPADPVDSSGVVFSRTLAAAGPTRSNTYSPRPWWRAFFDFFTGEPERTSEATVTEYYDMNRRQPHPSRMAIVAAMEDRAATQAQLASITAPTLLIWGARDPLLPRPAAATLASYMTSSPVSVVYLPDVGHYPPLEIPDRFSTLVETFIDSVAPAPPRSAAPTQR